jgi:hypothetical protein
LAIIAGMSGSDTTGGTPSRAHCAASLNDRRYTTRKAVKNEVRAAFWLE